MPIEKQLDFLEEKVVDECSFDEKIAGEIVTSDNPGQKMREWREAFGINQSRVAELAGWGSGSIVGQYERGERKPGYDILRRFVGSIATEVKNREEMQSLSDRYRRYQKIQQDPDRWHERMATENVAEDRFNLNEVADDVFSESTRFAEIYKMLKNGRLWEKARDSYQSVEECDFDKFYNSAMGISDATGDIWEFLDATREYAGYTHDELEPLFSTEDMVKELIEHIKKEYKRNCVE